MVKIAVAKAIKEGKPWQEYLQENDQEIIEEIRLKTGRGLVVGTDKFVAKLEKALNRSLKYLAPGRPKKNG